MHALPSLDHVSFESFVCVRIIFSGVCVFVRHGHEAQFPFLMEANQVDLNGKPEAVWRYLIRAATLGML